MRVQCSIGYIWHGLQVKTLPQAQGFSSRLFLPFLVAQAYHPWCLVNSVPSQIRWKSVSRSTCIVLGTVLSRFYHHRIYCQSTLSIQMTSTHGDFALKLSGEVLGLHKALDGSTTRFTVRQHQKRVICYLVLDATTFASTPEPNILLFRRPIDFVSGPT